MAEGMGDGDVLFNTYNTSNQIMSASLPWSNPWKWHSVKTEIRDENGEDVNVTSYYDGKLVETQYGASFIGKPLHLQAPIWLF